MNPDCSNYVVSWFGYISYGAREIGYRFSCEDIVTLIVFLRTFINDVLMGVACIRTDSYYCDRATLI